MSENQYTSINPNEDENKMISNSNFKSSIINNNSNQIISDDIKKNEEESKKSSIDEKKSKKSKKDENVLYLTVEEEEEPVHVKIKRIIPKLIDEYVTTYKKPIRRTKLQDLVFAYDERLSKFYETEKEAAVAVFSFALTKLLRERKIVKVKDPDKKRPTYFILPKHIEMFKKA